MTFEVRAFEARTASWWYRIRDDVDANPPYQRRGSAWDKFRQSFLIDSILNDFDLPKLYLADFTYFTSPLNQSRKRFAVIDGKQRLSAIFSFLDDQLPLAPDFVLRENPELELAGLTYSEIRRVAPEVTSKVENFNLPVMSVITDDESAVQELFVRLNSGKPLTAAERRNAMGGVVPELIREILSSPFFESCVAFSARGGAHEQAAAKLLLLELHDGPVDLKRAQLDDLYKQGEAHYASEDIGSAATAVLETASTMSAFFTPHDPLLRTQGQLPVYYLMFRGGPVPTDVGERIALFHRLRRASTTQSDVHFPRSIMQALLRYSNRMRSPNDAFSVLEMSDILSWFVRVESQDIRVEIESQPSIDGPRYDYRLMRDL